MPGVPKAWLYCTHMSVPADTPAPVSLELLSPARDAGVGRAAILAGADAVYIGAPSFGARAAATNTVADIASLAAFAHRYRARVYVTMNTILYDSEIAGAQSLVWQLYAAGADALIVQDMAYLQMHLPPIALHASTQCDIRTPQKAAWLSHAGFSQIVLARELSLSEISACAKASDVPVEVFVHGALCVSFSGDCRAGYLSQRRSANRGECPQMCRMAYDLTDKNGTAVAPRAHYLSLRDMQRLDSLVALADAGARSFKIEGRLKDRRYVSNVTAAYSCALDAIVAASGGRYRRASAGEAVHGFTPDTQRTFNRRYTDYFLRQAGKMASHATPGWCGVEAGRVTRPYDSRRRCFEACTSLTLNNGDGLGYFDADGKYCGFRLNRIDGSRLYPATVPEGLRPGTVIYRNSDKTFFNVLDGENSRRHISLNIVIRRVDDNTIAVSGSDDRGVSATVAVLAPAQTAQTPQGDTRAKILAKTGGTIYRAGNIDDRLGEDSFVAASVLTQSRRTLLDALDRVAEATYCYDRRRVCALAADAFAADAPLTYRDNVANALARQFYTRHGAGVAQNAIETDMPSGEIVAMSCRYCLRRELDACLKDGDRGRRLPSPLYLRTPAATYRLDFDCRNCRMNLIVEK